MISTSPLEPHLWSYTSEHLPLWPEWETEQGYIFEALSDNSTLLSNWEYLLQGHSKGYVHLPPIGLTENVKGVSLKRKQVWALGTCVHQGIEVCYHTNYAWQRAEFLSVWCCTRTDHHQRLGFVWFVVVQLKKALLWLKRLVNVESSVPHVLYAQNSLPVPHGCVCQGVGVGGWVGVFMHMHACSCVGAHVWGTSKRWGRKATVARVHGVAMLCNNTSGPDWPQILGDSSRKPEIVRQGRWRSGWRPWCKQHRCQRSCTPCQRGCPQTAR